MNVLLVDDDADIRETISILLELHGHQVSCAANGREALNRLRDGLRPDVILLDLMMPVMSGWEFRRETERDAALVNIPVIVVTGDTRAAERARDLGATAHLRKPFEELELIGLIDRVAHHSG